MAGISQSVSFPINQRAQLFAPNQLFGISTKYASFYTKPHFLLTMRPEQTVENPALIKEFNENIKNNELERSFKFKLTNDRSVWIKKDQLIKSQVLNPAKGKSEWDLSIISDIYSIEGEQVIMKALQFCYTGFIKLHEQKEMTSFLLVSFLLQIAKPFEYIANVIPAISSEIKIQLKDKSEIIDIDLLFQACEGNQAYYQLIQENATNNITNGLKEYQSFLKNSNPQYFLLSPQLNPQTGKPSFHPKLVKYNFIWFNEFLNELGSVLFPQNENNFYTFDNVKYFHSTIEFYCKEQTFPGGENEMQYTIQKLFEFYYPSIESNLSEDDKMSCLLFFVSDKKMILEQLQSKKLELRMHKELEVAFQDILFAQYSQNMMFQQSQQRYNPNAAIQTLTSEQIRQQIKQDVDQEINRLNQQR